jgi:hypothetical protein
MEIAEYIANGGRAEEMLVEIGEAAKVAADKGTKGAKERSKAEEEAARILGKAQQDGLNGYQALGRAIDAEKAKLESLRRAYGNGTSGNMSIFGDIKKSEKDLGDLMGLADTVGLKLGAPAGEKAAGNFIESFGSKLSLISDNPYVAVAGAAIGAVLAVPLVAAVEGALGTGVGVGGLAVGIAASIHSQAVQTALTGLKYDASAIFADVGRSFAGPVSAGVDDIDKMIKEVGPGLKSTFSAIAPDARILIDGVGGFIKGALPGLEDGFRNAQPLVQELARDLPILGHDVGVVFDDFTQGGQGSEDALHDLIVTVGDVAKTVGWLGKSAAETFSVMEFSADIVGLKVNKLAAEYVPVTAGTGDLTDAVDGFTEAAGRSSVEVDALNTAFEKWLTTAENADNATLALDRAQLTFTEHLKKGTKNWDESKKAGQEQVGNLNDLVQALTRKYDGLKVNGLLTEDQTKAELTLAESYYATAKAAGASQDELATLLGIVNDLKGQLNAIPPSKVVTFTTPGLVTASTATDNYYRQLNNIPKYIHTQVTVSYGSDGSSTASRMGRPNERISSSSAPHAAVSQSFGTPMAILGQAASSYGTRVASGGGGPSSPVHLTVQLLDAGGRVTRSALIQDALNRGVPQATAKAAYP